MKQALIREARAQILEGAVSNDRHSVTTRCLDLTQKGVAPAHVITEILASVQVEVGWLWQTNRLSVSQEHTATGVVDHALAAVALDCRTRPSGAKAVVACAEDNWHSLGARMAAELLTLQGWTVTFLGAATAADQLDQFLRNTNADLVAISCALPTQFEGVRRQARVAADHGVAVAISGSAVTNEARAIALGATRMAVDATLTAFRPTGASSRSDDTWLDTEERAGIRSALSAERSTFVERATLALANVIGDDSRVSQRVHEDCQSIVSFADAAMVIGDPTVFSDFVEWMQVVFTSRDVSATLVQRYLDAIRSATPASLGPLNELIDHGLEGLDRLGR